MEANTTSGTVPLEEYERLAEKYQKLYKNYRDLEEKQTKYKAYIETANQKYHAAKESARQWLAWIERHKIEARPSAGEDDSSTPKAVAKRGVDYAIVTSSQTTEGNPEGLEQANHELAVDGDPEFICARSLKRRKMEVTPSAPIPVIVKQEPTSPGSPVKINSEDYSSPELGRQRPIRSETSDLDAFVQHMDTPRKRKSRRATSEGTERPVSLLPTTSSLSEGNQPETSGDDLFVKATAGSNYLGPQYKARNHDIRSTKEVGNVKALRERSVNIPSPPNKARGETTMHRKRKRASYPSGVSIVSEDGDDLMSQVTTPNHAPDSAAHKNSRLDALLDEPQQDEEPLPRRRTPLKKSFLKPKSNMATIKQEPGVQRSVSPLESTRSKRPRGLEKSPAPAEPEDEPLRFRSLKVLRLDDFKVNPNYVGSDFAFADSFRGRERRRCLQGCTRPDCCGNAFRKAIEIGGVLSTKNDSEVLEEYLGPDFATLMAAYGPEKRKEITKQAHANSFANQHGKHRHAFERRSTPPGFWRTDMPTTQEEEQDRAAALEMERKLVEDRWREAMRSGRWLFRDE